MRSHDRSHHASATAWRLRSTSTNKVVECRVETTRPRLFAVDVLWGMETLLHETYPDSTTAHSRAMDLRDRLLKRGDWEPDPFGTTKEAHS